MKPFAHHDHRTHCFACLEFLTGKYGVMQIAERYNITEPEVYTMVETFLKRGMTGPPGVISLTSVDCDGTDVRVVGTATPQPGTNETLIGTHAVAVATGGSAPSAPDPDGSLNGSGPGVEDFDFTVPADGTAGDVYVWAVFETCEKDVTPAAVDSYTCPSM